MQALREVSGPKDDAEFVRKARDIVNPHWTDVSPSQAFLCCSPSWCGGQVLTDANFPESERLWEGSTFKFLGSGVYYKKVLFIRLQVCLSILPDGREPCSGFSNSLPGMAVLTIPDNRLIVVELLQVYAAALYVEADTARAELKRLQKEGFFSQGFTDDRVMEALMLGKFRKVMQIQMLRSASESQVTPQRLMPRLAIPFCRVGQIKAEITIPDQTLTPCLLAITAYHAQVKRIQPESNNRPKE